MFDRRIPLRRGGVVLVAAAALAAVPSSALAATRSISPTGSDSGNCASFPCRTMDYAYKQSQPGDVVQLAGGNYPAQDLNAIPGRVAPAVEFRPAAGATVSLDNLDVGASYVTLRSLKINNILDTTGQSSPAVGVSLYDVSGPQLYIQNVRDFSVTGGGWGPRTDKQPVIVGSSPESYNLTFDGVDFHDALVSNPDVHTECAMILNVQKLAIRNSMFRNCTYFGLMIADLYGSLDPSDTTLENNVFERTRQSNGDAAPFSMIVGPIRADNFVIRNNTFQTEPAFNGTAFTNSRFVGNIAPIGACYGGLTYAYNLFTSRTCSSTDKQNANAMNQFRNPGAHDWHLTAGAAAIDAASPTDKPAGDRDGIARTDPPETGAYEFATGETTPAPPTPTPTPTPNPTPPTPTPTPTPPTPTPTPTPPPVTPPAQVAPVSGLVGAWSFDEASGTTAADASGRGNAGTVSGATVVTGKFGRARSFDGVNDWVTIPDSASLDLTSGMTIEAWVKPSALGASWRTVAIKQLSGDLSYALYAHTDRGGPTGHVNPSSDTFAAAKSPLATGTWTHLSSTYDGSAVRLYANGKLIATQPASGAIRTGTGALRIGGNDVWSEWFKGAIDEVRVYDRALTATEIQADSARAIAAT